MRFPAVFSVSIVFIVLLAGCGEASTTSFEEPATTSASTTTTVGPEPPRRTDSPTVTGDGVRVVEVVDGDTIDIELAGDRETVRLIGINAPERGECIADEATRWLRERVTGQHIDLVVDRTDRDQYGRLIRYVEVDGTDVGDELVRAGLALAHRYPPDTARSDGYEAAQREAETASTGLWAADACGGGTTDAELAISEIRFDADGDDNKNLNDEWVRITNQGSSPADLTRWVLKDTSATHRYTFPSGFVLEPGASVTVRTGCATDSATDLHWCNQGSAVWNNSGDTAFLLDPAGAIVDSRSG